MTNVVEGKTLADCFALVARCGAELNGLRDALDNILEEHLTSQRGSLPCVVAGETEHPERMDDSTWVCTDIASNLPLKGKGMGKKNPERFLGYQVSMTGDGIAIPGNIEPLLHVFCWDDPCDFNNEVYIGFPFPFGDDNRYEVIDDRLMLWGGQEATEWNERAWTFSLRLTTLNSLDDLKTYVVKPALALLKGEDIRIALPEEWLDKTLIRYPAKEHLVA